MIGTLRLAMVCALVCLGCGEDDECYLSDDCPMGTHCANGRCGAECGSDSDCDEKWQTCDERGRCLGGGGDVDVDTDVDVDADTDTDVQCYPPQEACDGLCVYTETDVNNCGGCGIACDSSTRAPDCTLGDCVCGSSSRECAGTADDLCCGSAGYRRCVDTETDETNCGGCTITCNSATEAQCVGGDCTCGADGTCLGTTADRCCNMSDVFGVEDYQCIDTTNDPEHCGSCTNVCDAETAADCVSGSCQCGTDGICSGTLTDTCCDTGTENRCVDMSRSNQHCGTCGNGCEAGVEVCYDGDCQCGCETDEDCEFIGDGFTCTVSVSDPDCDSDGYDEGTCS